jgi:hypothetical protein
VLHFENERFTYKTQFIMSKKLNQTTKPQHDAKLPVMPSVCVHPITYATYTKFCPRKCLLCGEFVKQTGA